jgi:uncharacterized repeat protein (TIGR01451 family)/gliding motility-associated-like protein
LTNTSNVVQTVVYTVTPKSGAVGSCVGDPFTVTVTVNPTPVIQNRAAIICSGEAFEVIPFNGEGGDIVPAGTTYTWIVNDNPNVHGYVNQATPQTSISQTLTNTSNVVQNMVYTVTPISQESGFCVGSSFEIEVTVNPRSDISDKSAEICSGTAFTVTPMNDFNGDIVPSGTTYTWTVVDNIEVEGDEDESTPKTSISQTLINTSNIVQTVTYKVTPISGLAGACEGDPFTVTVIVNPEPIVADQSIIVKSDAPLALDFGTSTSVAADTYNITGLNLNGLIISAGSPAIGTGLLASALADDSFTNNTSAAVNVIYTIVPVSAVGCQGVPFTVTVTVKPGSVAKKDIISSSGDSPVSGNILPNDTDGNTLTVSGFSIAGLTGSFTAGTTATIPSIGTIVLNADGSFTFTAVEDYSGTVPVITYTVSDGNGGTDTGDLEITVTADNDALVDTDGDGVNDLLDLCPSIPGFNILGCPFMIDFNVTDIFKPLTGSVATNDFYESEVTYGEVISGNKNLEIGTLIVNPDGSYTFESPVPGVYKYFVPVCSVGPDPVCITVFLQLTVLDPSSNDNIPVVNPDFMIGRKDKPVVINVFSNDRSGNVGGALNYSSVKITEKPANGSVFINADGTMTFTPENGFTGDDVFSYSACEKLGTGSCSTSQVFVTVLQDNGIELITAADDYIGLSAGKAGSNSVIGNVLANDRSTDNNSVLTASLVKAPIAEQGTIVFNANGDFTFTPAPGFIGPVEVIYSVCDAEKKTCPKATLYILVKFNEIISKTDRYQFKKGSENEKLGNILDNDRINNELINSNDVIISIKDDGGISGIRVDNEGNLSIPKTTPAGTYLVYYRICETLYPSNCSETLVIIEVTESVDLRISKEVVLADWYEGDEIQYLIKITNIGNKVAKEVLVKDILPEGLRYVSSSVDGKLVVPNSMELTWKFDSLVVGSSIEILLKVKALALKDVKENRIVNIATVSSAEVDLTESDNTASAEILVKELFIPNVITPNNDGYNDRFEIKGLKKFVSSELVIFNRWGDCVFSQANYQNDWSASDLPFGVYFYILVGIDENDVDHEYKNWIQVIQ